MSPDNRVNLYLRFFPYIQSHNLIRRLSGHKFLGYILVFVSLCLIPFARAEVSLNEFLSEQDIKVYNTNDKFLRKMGFEDYASVAAQNLSQAQELSNVTKLALEKNSELMGVLNATRAMGNLVAVVMNRLQNQQKQYVYTQYNVLKQVIIQQLMPFPLLTMEPLPEGLIDKIQKMDISAGLQEKENWYKKRAVERYFVEKQNLVKSFSLIMSLQPSANNNSKKSLEQWLDETISASIIDSYTYEHHQQNRFLGRALVLSFVKFAREKKWTNWELSLNVALRNNNLFLENYTQPEYTYKDEKNEVNRIPLKTGDFALEYSHGQEAFFTSLVTQPSAKNDKDLAEKNSLLNRILDARMFLDTKTYYTALDKQDTYQPLSDAEEKIYSNFWNKKYANGFSHSGIVEVRHDEDSKLATAWIWDIYPEKNKIGPVRVMTPEGFSYPEKFLKIGFLSYDPKKLLASFKKQIAQRGYKKEIWHGYSSFVGRYDDGTRGPAIDKDESYTWHSRVDEKTVRSWTQLTDDQAEKWYYEIILPRVIKRVKEYAVGKQAVLFADGLVSAKDMLYCSQLMTMAFLEEANFDLQSSQEHLLSFLKFFSSSIQNTLKINVNSRLISPNGLIWQNEIFGDLNYHFFDRSRVTIQKQKKGPTQAEGYSHYLNDTLGLKNYQLDLTDDDTLELTEDTVQLDLES